MGILSWIVVGLIAGAIAKLVMPGNDPGGIIVTILIGIGGGLLGGFVSSAFLGMDSVSGLNLWSIVLSILGAIILLIAYRVVRSQLDKKKLTSNSG